MVQSKMDQSKMEQSKSLVKNVKDEWSQVRHRAEEALHNIWPFRTKEDAAAGDNTSRQTVSFPVDIYETADEYVLTGDLPGVGQDDLNIGITDTELSISGRCQIQLDHDEKVLHDEIPGADFRRTFTLSDGVDSNAVSAQLHDGLLTVRLGKSSKARPRQIEITS